jgi:hypothetical protein
MDHHVLVIHPGDKDLITEQLQHAMEKQFFLLKPNAAPIASPTTLQKLAFQSAPYTVASRKQCALAHSNYLKSKKTQPSSQPTSPPAVSTSMASHLLST